MKTKTTKTTPVKSEALAEVPAGSPGIYLVIWEDAKVVTEGAAWHTITDLTYEPYLVHQVGFLIKDVPAGIMISEAYADGLMGNPTQIPRGMIREMTKLA